MTMPDGNTAALRQHERAEDRAQELWDAYAPQVIRDVRQELLDGETLKRAARDGTDVTLIDLMLDGDIVDQIAPDDLYTLLRGDALQVQAVQDRMQPLLVKLIDDWLDSESGHSYVWRRIDDERKRED